MMFDHHGPRLKLSGRPWFPKRTVRLRLTLLYGGVFAASGGGLVAIAYLLVDNRLHSQRFVTGRRFPSNGALPGLGVVNAPRSTKAGLGVQQSADLHQFLVQSLIALGVMAVVSVLLGWLLAGRALSPLRTMTATTRRISERNLHERLGATGPSDELKDLGDTIDGLLGRLESAFGSQRQFVANASHELRTPLALQQMMLQVALADPELTLGSLRSTCQEVLEAGKQQERLIEALLILARGQRGIDEPVPVDIAETIKQALRTAQHAINGKGVDLRQTIEPATIQGDCQLVQIMIANLVENAVRYNSDDGFVQVSLAHKHGRPVLTISNSGPLIAAEQITRLLQPFQRLQGDRSGVHDGLGLGLSIVGAIASAHHAELVARPRSGGGLEVQVRFRNPSELADRS